MAIRAPDGANNGILKKMTQRNLYYKNNLVSQSSPLYVLHIWQFYMVQGGSYVDGTLKRELSIFMLEMTSSFA